MKGQYFRILKYFGFILIFLLSFSYASMQREANAVPSPSTARLQSIMSLFPSESDKVMYNPNTQQLTIRLSSFNFDFGQAKIIASRHDQLLANIKKVADMYPNAQITVTGHTDSVGIKAFNQRLSEERAESVRDYLENNFLLLNIKAVGAGENEPVCTNSTIKGRRCNRRIEVTFK